MTKVEKTNPTNSPVHGRGKNISILKPVTSPVVKKRVSKTKGLIKGILPLFEKLSETRVNTITRLIKENTISVIGKIIDYKSFEFMIIRINYSSVLQ